MAECKNEQACGTPEQKLVQLIRQLVRDGYHGSITLDFNRGVPQYERLRKVEVYDVVRR